MKRALVEKRAVRSNGTNPPGFGPVIFIKKDATKDDTEGDDSVNDFAGYKNRLVIDYVNFF